MILKDYSFENYFFNPKVMAQLGVISSEEEFMGSFRKNGKNTFTNQKWEKISGRYLEGIWIPEDVKSHMEDIRILYEGA